MPYPFDPFSGYPGPPIVGQDVGPGPAPWTPTPVGPVGPVGPVDAQDFQSALARLGQAAPAPRSYDQAAQQADTYTQEAINAEMASEDAKAAAGRAQQEQVVKDAELLNNKVGESLTERDLAKRKASEDALKEVEALNTRYDELAKKEPDPSRFWNSKSTFGKASLLIPLVLNSLVSRKTGQADAFLPIVMKLIDQDMASQERSLDLQREGIKSKKADVNARKAEAMALAEDEHGGRIIRLQSLDKLLQEREKLVGGDQQALARIADARGKLAAARASLVMEQGKVKEQRRHQAAEFAHDERMRQLSFSQGLAQEGARAAGDLRGVQGKTLGLTLVTKDGKEVQDFSIDKGQDFKDTTEIVSKANSIATLLDETEKALGNASSWQVLVKNNPEVQSLVIQTARAIATDNNFNKGTTANPDTAAAVTVVSGDPETFIGKLTNSPEALANFKKALHTYKRVQPALINYQLASRPLPPGAEGGKFVWTRPSLPPTPADPGKYALPGEKEASISNSLATEKDVGGNQLPRGTSLPPMTEPQAAKADELVETTKGMTARSQSEFIRAGLPGEENAAARKRLVAKQEKEFEDARKREGEAIEELRRLVRSRPVDNSDIREAMVDKGFDAAKLRPQDYEELRLIVERLGPPKEPKYARGRGEGY